jgi:hypothetical protein
MQVSGVCVTLPSWPAPPRRRPAANTCGAVNAVGPPSLPMRPRPVGRSAGRPAGAVTGGYPGTPSTGRPR